MMADYNRYISEYKSYEPPEMNRKEIDNIIDDFNAQHVNFDKVIKKARNAYITGISLAQYHLKKTDTLRLQLVLNFCVYQYEVLEECEHAFFLLKKTYKTG